MTPVDIEQLIRDVEARLTSRLVDVEKKIDDQANFQAGLQGAAKYGLAIITILGILVGIYAAIHGTPSSSGITK